MQRLDLGSYAKGVVVLLTNPVVIVPTLVAEFTAKLLSFALLGGPTGIFSSISGGLTTLLIFIIECFGFGVAMIAASDAWRMGRARIDVAWDDARRKLGDVAMAALGLNFALWIASMIGGFVFPGIGALALTAVAAYFFIYTLPAAAVGGTPGFAAMGSSVDRARANVPATLVLAVVTAALLILPQRFLFGYFFQYGMLAEMAFETVITAVVFAYLAVVTVRVFEDLGYSFWRRL
ncbi:MAG TPA: hypothetical protein VNJ51_13365 [Candidatus Dormibacteraeota bacterium]|nr:hypothetical protein [Candidatus Dormibacteraeota bacterium]